MVSRQLFEQCPQRAVVFSTVKLSSLSSGAIVLPLPSSRSMEMSALPYAPISPALSGRITSLPQISSNALSTELFMNVPP